MGFLRRLLGADNSLLLAFDHLSDSEASTFEEQVLEVKKYYRMTFVSRIADSLRHRRVGGEAAIVLTSARKSLFLRALPFLRSENIPFTLCLRPECIGLNRLPPEEELSIYAQTNLGKFQQSSPEKLAATAWEDPQSVESYLLSLRREVGPFPVESADPTRFFVTWGEVLELPPSVFEPAFYFSFSPRINDSRQSLEFVRTQVRRPVNLAFCPRECETSDLKGLGVEAAVIPENGMILNSSDPYRLPLWRFVEEQTK